jgi:molybdate transport system regulatory protein
VTLYATRKSVLKGVIKELTVGPVNAEITVELTPGLEITSVITNRSCQNLGLEVGKSVFAIVKASSVMIGTD